jgi:hypothetical protein
MSRNDRAVLEQLGFETAGVVEEQEGQTVLLDFGDEEHLATPGGLSEYGRFCHAAEEGAGALLYVTSCMVNSRTFNALCTIGSGDNWQKIASALAVMFHTADNQQLRVQKAKGYDRLRDLVTTCVTDLRRENHPLPDNYGKLAERLFASRGYQLP